MKEYATVTPKKVRTMYIAHGQHACTRTTNRLVINTCRCVHYVETPIHFQQAHFIPIIVGGGKETHTLIGLW